MDVTSGAAPEMKAASEGGEIRQAFEEFMGAFEAFKDVNDERLAAIETRMSADVLSEEKVVRIDAALDQQQRRIERLALKAARPELGGERRPAEVVTGIGIANMVLRSMTTTKVGKPA